MGFEAPQNMRPSDIGRRPHALLLPFLHTCNETERIAWRCNPYPATNLPPCLPACLPAWITGLTDVPDISDHPYCLPACLTVSPSTCHRNELLAEVDDGVVGEVVLLLLLFREQLRGWEGKAGRVKDEMGRGRDSEEER